MQPSLPVPAPNSNPILFGWACTFCSELNGPEIYRCANCRRTRELNAPLEEITVKTPPMSAREAAHAARIRSATPLRATWIYFRGSRDPGSLKWRMAALGLVLFEFLILASLRPNRDGIQPIVQATTYGLFALIVAYVSARRYRTDARFILPVSVISACLTAGAIALFYVLSVSLPQPGGRSLGEVVATSIVPGADPVLVILGTIAATVVALILILRLAPPRNGRTA